jgi:S1-C subfamily serine protease
MKKVLLVVVLVLFSGASFSDEWENKMRSIGYYDGDPNQTQILESTNDYIVIRNLTAKTNLKYYTNGEQLFINAEIFEQEATTHCRKNKRMRSIGLVEIAFDENTLYVFCNYDIIQEFSKKYSLDSKTDNWSEKNFESYVGIFVCLSYALKDIREKICDSRDYKKGLKRFPKADTIFDLRKKRRKEFTENTFVYEIKKRVLAKASQPSISTEDQNTVVAASSGTGFFVSTNGHMVTNNHVIEGCDVVKAHYKGRELDADVLFTDRSNDLAIIKTNIKPEKVFPVSNEDVSLLEDIIVAGYPLGKNISASIKTFKGSVTALAGFGDNYSNFQIDASLSSGNSGGPIINQKGNVVGVAVEKLVEVGVEGFNFGVKSSTLKTFASSNQIKFQDPSTEELSNKELGQLITEATIYLECWMSVAKIKQIIQEGERQKAFFSEYK